MSVETILFFPVIATLLCVILLIIDGRERNMMAEKQIAYTMLTVFLFLISDYIVSIRYLNLSLYLDVISKYIVLCIYPRSYAATTRIMKKKSLKHTQMFKLMIVPTVWVALYIIGVSQLSRAEYINWLYPAPEFSYAHPGIVTYLNVLLGLNKAIFLIMATWLLVKHYRLLSAAYLEKENLTQKQIDRGKFIIQTETFFGVSMELLLFLCILPDTLYKKQWTSIIIGLLILAWVLYRTYRTTRRGFASFSIRPLEVSLDSLKLSEQEEEKKDAEQEEEQEEEAVQTDEPADQAADNRQDDELGIKLQQLLQEEKLYTSGKLTVDIVARRIGTNRSYLSAYINNKYGMHFNQYIHTYRIEELKRILLKNNTCTKEELADMCGFGSVESMTRAVSLITGKTFAEFKNNILQETNEEMI